MVQNLGEPLNLVLFLLFWSYNSKWVTPPSVHNSSTATERERKIQIIFLPPIQRDLKVFLVSTDVVKLGFVLCLWNSNSSATACNPLLNLASSAAS
jgi:hypothetical protein